MLQEFQICMASFASLLSWNYSLGWLCSPCTLIWLLFLYARYKAATHSLPPSLWRWMGKSVDARTPKTGSSQPHVAVGQGQEWLYCNFNDSLFQFFFCTITTAPSAQASSLESERGAADLGPRDDPSPRGDMMAAQHCCHVSVPCCCRLCAKSFCMHVYTGTLPDVCFSVLQRNV